jgi:plasmid stabilization system protein ParE
MKVVYHRLVHKDVSQAQRHYDRISIQLGDEFWDELMALIEKAATNPLRYRAYSEPLRRANLKRFPYHFLFRVISEGIRITVVRHNKRHPNYGVTRR